MFNSDGPENWNTECHPKEEQSYFRFEEGVILEKWELRGNTIGDIRSSHPVLAGVNR